MTSLTGYITHVDALIRAFVYILDFVISRLRSPISLDLFSYCLLRWVKMIFNILCQLSIFFSFNWGLFDQMKVFSKCAHLMRPSSRVLLIQPLRRSIVFITVVEQIHLTICMLYTLLRVLLVKWNLFVKHPSNRHQTLEEGRKHSPPHPSIITSRTEVQGDLHWLAGVSCATTGGSFVCVCVYDVFLYNVVVCVADMSYAIPGSLA